MSELISAVESQLVSQRLLPATPAHVIAKIRALEEPLIGHEPVDVPTEHVIHAGIYARTIVMPRGMVLTGALLKRGTVLIVVGSVSVLAGEEWMEMEGYNVIPASAGRKQVFESRSPVIITMLIPTQARTVEEVEAEITDEGDRLLSRRQNANTVVITGE